MSTLKFIFALLTLAVYVYQVQGLRGCTNYGHSCFGAHGKRTPKNDEKDQTSFLDSTENTKHVNQITTNDVPGVKNGLNSAFLRKWMTALRQSGNDEILQ
uniref:Uncharacterized protein n=1 Tax=Strigamia maritima TaxID=126957 RepID=T1IXA4_STRMM